MKFDDLIKSVEENNNSAFFYTPSFYKKAFSYLFLKPHKIISIRSKNELGPSFNKIQKLIDKGYYGYTLINYEAGFLFEKRFEDFILDSKKPLIQFFFFKEKDVKSIKSSKIIFDNFSDDGYAISNFTLNRSENCFKNDIKKIKEYIKAGDTYQVNYTIKAKFDFKGSLNSFTNNLVFNQSAKYTAIINSDSKIIVSLSPELFFQKIGKKIESHPMKGTARRGLNENEDNRTITELSKHEKNLAENVMIVDLIRNDLGKICRYGSINVPRLFKVEKYESVLQMISVVRGNLGKKTKLLDILSSIFPCGSVTGAPKIRTMEIINEIEKEKRGIYTGAVGLITPDEIKMNVAIRTITLNKKSNKGIMGLGSGIVWDSEPFAEYEEVLLKSKFLTEPTDYFELFETMRFENNMLLFFEEHFKRLKSAADYFLFKFNEKKIRNQVEEEIAGLDKKLTKKLKLSLNKWGKIRIETLNLPKPDSDISVIISQKNILSNDRFRQFKTTNRKLYEDQYSYYSSKGFSEIIFLNEKGNVAEGSRTNVFIRNGNDWCTPSLDSGALPGIYRNYFINNCSNVYEREIKLDELLHSEELVLTNSVRGEIKVGKIFVNQTEFFSYK